MALGRGEQQALDSLKSALTSAPVLALASFKDIVASPFHFQTDASNTGLGVVLTQVQDGEERVISLASRTLLSAERNYSVTEREYLAVVYGNRSFSIISRLEIISSAVSYVMKDTLFNEKILKITKNNFLLMFVVKGFFLIIASYQFFKNY